MCNVKVETQSINLPQKIYKFDKNHVTVEKTKEAVHAEIKNSATKSQYWPYREEKFLTIKLVKGLILNTGYDKFEFVYASGAKGLV